MSAVVARGVRGESGGGDTDGGSNVEAEDEEEEWVLLVDKGSAWSRLVMLCLVPGRVLLVLCLG